MVIIEFQRMREFRTLIFEDLNYPGQPHPIGSDRNSSEVVEIFGIEFRHLTSSGRNPMPGISATSDEFLSDPMKSDSRITRPGYF